MSPAEKTELQQKAYPSAFEQSNNSAASSLGAFGATDVLPRQKAEPGSHVTEGLPAVEETTDAFAPVEPDMQPVGDAFGQGLPVISMSQVKDPSLREYLLAHADSEKKSTDDSTQAFGASPELPVNPAASSEPVTSPFEPAAAPVNDRAPLTSAIPLATTTLPVASSQGMQQASYPSVAPITTGIPTVSPGHTPVSRVKSSLKSFVQADKSLTKPIRGLERISQRQFALSSRRHRERYVREKEEAREVLNFTLRLAETMFHYGADAMDVDSAIVAVCAAYGLDDVEVDITNQSVIINYVSDIDDVFSSEGVNARSSGAIERFSHTVVRVVRSWSENYAALSDIYKLINSITEKGMTREQADRQLRKINNAKKLYPPLVVLLGNAVAAGALTIGIGGSWRAGVVSLMLFLCVYFLDQFLSKLQMPSFFHMAASAAFITFAAISLGDENSFLTQVGLPVSAPHIVAAGLIMLVPTFKLVSSVQDAINGFPLTAAGRFVSTGMSFLGLVVGLATGVTALSFVGAQPLDVSQSAFVFPSPLVNTISMTIGTIAIGITTQARLRTLMWITLVTLSGLLTYHGFTAVFGSGSGRGNTAVAAFVVGLLSMYLAHRFHAPQTIFSIPSLTFLLPGLSMFRGLYSFTVESNSALGVPGIIAALAIILSMASGVVLGGYITQYLVQTFKPVRTSEENTQVLDR